MTRHNAPPRHAPLPTIDTTSSQVAQRLVLRFDAPTGRWFLQAFGFPYPGLPLATREESDRYQLALVSADYYEESTIKLEF